jgi:hypothetical protein
LSGWLVGLPLTSGPVVFFLAIDQGSRFATTAALAVLLGTISQAAFAVAYAQAAVRTGWLIATPAGCGAFAPFPVYAGVLAVFAHRQSGDAASNVLKGLLLGLFSFAAFFTLLAVELSRLGIGLAFLLATAAALTVQGASLMPLRAPAQSAD